MVHLTRAHGILRAVLSIGVVAALAAAMALPHQAGASAYVTAAATGPVAYQGKLPCCQNLVLGPQSTPTVVVQTPPLPAGKYLVNAIVNASIASNDQIVCAIGPSTQPGSNDGIFGTAGNDGTGTLGLVYGTAAIADAFQITTSGTTLVLSCNAFNFGKGTYASAASITALRVGSLTVSTQ